MRTPVRRADEHLRWLRLVGKDVAERGSGHPGRDLRALLPALTGCDFRALEAIDRLWTLHCYCDHPARVITAIAYAALEMQDSTRPLARELIAHAKDWGDRERLWPLVEAEMARIESGALVDDFMTAPARARAVDDAGPENDLGLAGVAP